MAKFLNPSTGMVEEIGAPELNPELVAGKTLVPDTTPLGTITGSALAPTTPITPVQPEPVPLDSALAITEPPTPTETAFETERKRIQEIEGQLAGKAGAQAQLEQQFITPEETALADYTTQLRDIQAQQRELRTNLEGQMAGRASQGTIDATIAKQQRELTVDALRVSSLIDSTQGRIGAAERKIDRAIRAKYGALEAERDAKIRNLELLLKSPALDREEKIRAQRELARQNALKQADATKKQTEERTWKLANEVAANLAKQGKIADPRLLQQIRDADENTALQLAAPYLAAEDKATGDIAEFKAFFPNVDITTPAGQQQYLNWKERVGAAGRAGGGLGETDQASIDSWVKLLSQGQTQIYNIPTKIRNAVIARATELGAQILSPTFAKAAKEAQASFSSAQNQLNLISSLSNKVIQAEGISGLPRQAILNLPLVRLTSQDRKVYADSVDAFLSMLTRAAGEKGVLTNVDVGRIKKALPSPYTDTIATANEKLTNFRNLLQSIRDGTVDAFTANQFGITLKTDTDIIKAEQPSAIPEHFRTKYKY